MKTYLEALADGDGEKACDQLTGEAKRAVLDEISGQLPEFGAASCEDALDTLAENLGEDEKSALRDAEIEVKVDGDTATARPAKGTDDAELRKIDGKWLISRIPF